jgi:hypothetical protein
LAQKWSFFLFSFRAIWSKTETKIAFWKKCFLHALPFRALVQKNHFCKNTSDQGPLFRFSKIFSPKFGRKQFAFFYSIYG